MESDSPRREALAFATRALARREHSRRSLQERLLRAGVTPEDAEPVIEELCQAGLVDDGRFAHEKARVFAERGKGDTAIRFELVRAGGEPVGVIRDPAINEAIRFIIHDGTAKIARELQASGG